MLLHQVGTLAQYRLRVKHPVNKVDFLWRPVAQERAQLVGRPVLNIAVAGIPVQVLVDRCAAGEPFSNLGVGRNASAHIGAGAHKIPRPKRNLACLEPVRRRICGFFQIAFMALLVSPSSG